MSEAEDGSQGRISRRNLGRKAVPILGGAVVGSTLLPGVAQAATSPWNLTGNAGTLATNFLGTTDAKPLAVRTTNTERLRVTSAGDVGIATSTPGARLHVVGTTIAGLFARTPATGSQPALQATTASRDANATALFASVSPTAPGSNSAAVRGSNAGTAGFGIGVWGSQAGAGIGVLGSTGAGGTGVRGTATGNGFGISGANVAVGGGGGGGQFTGDQLGISAVTVSPGVAIRGQSAFDGSLHGVGVQGYAGSGSAANVHPGATYWDAGGEFSGLNGVIGAASPDVSDGYGVIGIAQNTSGVGVYAYATGGARALVANGNADILGTLTKSGGSFRIDHPLAPADRYLSHSFVESPDMKNIYDGVVIADGTGSAGVTMPDWFDALNRDFRYQLTPIGEAAPDLHIADRLKSGHFRIAGAKPGQEISWQVTGIRQDAWANAHRIPVDEPKPKAEKGSFLHPELFGAAASRQVRGSQSVR